MANLLKQPPAPSPDFYLQLSQSWTTHLAALKEPPKPVFWCPDAKPDQVLLLSSLHDDALAMIVDVVFDSDELSEYCGRSSVFSIGFRHHPSTLALSLVNNRLRAACIPKLFRSVFRLTASMGEMNLRLRDLEGHHLFAKLPPVLDSVKTCELVTTSRHNIAFARTRLARTLPKMHNLRELSVTHRKEIDVSGLRATFHRANVNLPSIRALRIQSRGSWAFLVEACPNTEILILADNLYDDDLMQAARGLKKLRNLELSSSAWALQDIEYINTAIPDIEGLTLKGEIDDAYLSSWASAFARLEHLRSLTMTTVQHVTDEDAEAQCWNDSDSMDFSCFGGIQFYHDCNEEQQDVASAYFRHCDELESLCFVFLNDTTTWNADRRSDGFVEHVFEHCEPCSGEPPSGADPQLWHKHRMKHHEQFRRKYDRDGFPKLVSFPGEVLGWEEWRDPPKFGFTHEETTKRIDEKRMYYDWEIK